jgi:hypothetical protein
MKVTGLTTLFVEERMGNNFFSTTISRKAEDGTYKNCSLDVRFNKEKFPKESLDKLEEDKAYKLNVLDGFLSVRTYKDKEGKEHRIIYLQVEDGKLEGSKEINKSSQNSSALPF